MRMQATRTWPLSLRALLASADSEELTRTGLRPMLVACKRSLRMLCKETLFSSFEPCMLGPQALRGND